MLFFRHEAKLPAEEDEARPYARFPCTPQDQDGEACYPAPDAQGSRPLGSLMPASYRLSRTDFTRMRGFMRVHGTLFSLSFGTLPERKSPGFACVVSAKTAPRANARNRIKRQVREAMRGAVSRLPQGTILVFHAKKPATGADAASIRAEIFALARKSGNSID